MIYITLIVIKMLLTFMYVIFNNMVKIVHTSSLNACSRSLNHRWIYVLFKDTHNCMTANSINNRRCLYISFLWTIFHMKVFETCYAESTIHNVFTEICFDCLFFLS